MSPLDVLVADLSATREDGFTGQFTIFLQSSASHKSTSARPAPYSVSPPRWEPATRPHNVYRTPEHCPVQRRERVPN